MKELTTMVDPRMDALAWLRKQLADEAEELKSLPGRTWAGYAAEDVIAWHRASRPPGPIPAHPLGLALDGSLRFALDRDLALRALERLERERRRLRAERLAVQEARQRLLAGRYARRATDACTAPVAGG
jgi:hypothetical protein